MNILAVVVSVLVVYVLVEVLILVEDNKLVAEYLQQVRNDLYILGILEIQNQDKVMKLNETDHSYDIQYTYGQND